MPWLTMVTGGLMTVHPVVSAWATRGPGPSWTATARTSPTRTRRPLAGAASLVVAGIAASEEMRRHVGRDVVPVLDRGDDHLDAQIGLGDPVVHGDPIRGRGVEIDGPRRAGAHLHHAHHVVVEDPVARPGHDD